MKKKQWLGKMELVDEEYVTEADPTKKSASNQKRWFRWGAIAACLVMIVTASGLWLFLPTFEEKKINQPSEDVDYLYQYRDSEYFEIIQKLEAWRIEKHKQNQNYDSILGDKGVGNTNGNYVAITDYQVNGVLEADLIKRSDEYAYYVNKNVFEIYSIDGENSVLIGSYRYEPRWDDQYTTRFYLSQDCQTATLIYSTFHSGTMVLSLDLSNPTHINEIATFEMGGSYQTSRMVDGTLLVFSHTGFSYEQMDYSKPHTFLPRFKENGDWKYVSSEYIVCPENVVFGYYTTVFQLTEETLELQQIKSFLSYDEEYVSEDTIFMKIVDRKNSFKTTEIVGLNYRDGFDMCGSISIEGEIKDQYSMDVHEGGLRVVTTTADSASLYCIDLSDWSIAASVENFAPIGESVRSVRFDGDYAYVCTSIRFRDPVFFFDLSDWNNITYKDTGTIPGFSNSLVDFENGKLLGIGVGEQSNIMKIEIYQEGEDDVESVCAYLSDADLPTYFSSSYKSYYIDRENQLIGLGYRQYIASPKERNIDERYLLLQFDGEKLNVLLDVQLQGDERIKRGFYADGYFYLFGESDFSVHKIAV